MWSEPTQHSLSHCTAQHYEWLQVQSQLLLDDRNPSIIFGKPQLKVELANHSRFHWNWFANAKFDNAVWSFWNCKLGVWSSSSVKWEKLSVVLFCCCCCRRYTRFSWNSHSKLRLRCGSDFPRCILNHVFQVSILGHCGILSLLCWSRLHLRDKRWSLIKSITHLYFCLISNLLYMVRVILHPYGFLSVSFDVFFGRRTRWCNSDISHWLFHACKPHKGKSCNLDSQIAQTWWSCSPTCVSQPSQDPLPRASFTWALMITCPMDSRGRGQAI